LVSTSLADPTTTETINTMTNTNGSKSNDCKEGTPT